jgi:PAS domain S-box-containing protein
MPSPATEFESLLEAVPDALLGVDRSGQIRFANHLAESLFGYDPGELVGIPLESLVPESVRRAHKAHREGYNTAPRARPMGTDLSLTGLRRDGTEIPVDISLSSSGSGDDMRVIAAVRDMTGYRRTEADRRRVDRVASIVEFSGDAIIGSTLGGVVTSWNPAAEKLYGYPAQEIIGKSIGVLNPGDRPEETQAVLSQIAHAHTVETLETVHVRKDGTRVAVSQTLSPIHGDGGAIVGASLATRDVTEQRQAIDSARRLAALVEQSPDAVITASLDGQIMTWNPAAERIFGYTREEAVGKLWRRLSPAEGAAQITNIIAAITRGEPVVREESVRIRKDGTVFPVALTSSPIRDAYGAVIGASTILRDMTYQNRTFESARSMIETSLDSFVAISPAGAITDANEAMVRITGVPRDKLIGTPFSDYFTDPEKADEICQRVFTEGKAENYPLTLRHRDGHDTKTDVLFNATVFLDPAGTVLGAFAAARDVTEQKKAAQYARSLIEAALDPMVTISPEGTITDSNEATARATGVPREALIGTSFSDYFTEPVKANEAYQKVFEQGAVTDYPLTLRHRNGHGARTEIMYNASLYRDTDGNVLGVFASAHDVTKQVLAQKKLAEQQARELERLAELERFQRLTVGRELKMIELKKQIEYLRKHGPAGGGER